MHKLSVEAPPKILVERYLIEIAKNYNVPYEPDSVVMVSLSQNTEENDSVGGIFFEKNNHILCINLSRCVSLVPIWVTIIWLYVS
jgi:hypothetical protein